MLVAILAMDNNRAIGYQNDLPWERIPRDMKHFKDTTLNNPVAMGTNTWWSLPEKFRPLPERKNYILSRDPEKTFEGGKRVSLEEIVELSKNEDIFVMGGAEVYTALLPYTDKIIITHIDGEFEADTYFPDFDENEWEIRESETVEIPAGKEEKTPYNLRIEYLYRKSA